MINIVQQLLPVSLYNLKSTYSMVPEYITIHDTANSASAKQEVAYMLSNKDSTSFHGAVDEIEFRQAIPFDRNAWHAGDGISGPGNRKSIGIEICYSTDYDTDRHWKAMMNAVEVVRMLMKEWKIPIDHVVQHNYWSGKDCPHRIREEGTWQMFLLLCEGKGEISMGKLSQGHQIINWNGKTIHVYGQKDGQELGLISTDGWNEVQTINKLDYYGALIFAKENCSFFINETKDPSYGMVLGRELGFTKDEAPNQSEWLDLAVLPDNTTVVGDFSSGDYRKPYAKVSFSPGGVFLYEGKDVTMYSTAKGVGLAKFNENTPRSMLLQDANKRFYFAVTPQTVKITGSQCRQFAKEYGMTLGVLLDSGGSAQLIVDGVKIVYSGRAIPNALCFYTPLNKPVQPEDPKEEGEEIMRFYFKVAKATYTINGKGAIATRETPLGNYDTKFPLYVGDVFSVTGEPYNSKGEPVYKIATGRQAGRYVIVESTDMKNGYLIPVVKPE